MRIRKQGNRQWLDRAYEYVANNGADTSEGQYTVNIYDIERDLV
mgnify:CR=1 FL=1